MPSVTENLNLDSPGRKYLMGKLRVFDQPLVLPVPVMKTATDASENLSFAMNEYAQKNISEDTLMQIRSACEVFSKLMVATDIEVRLTEIEALLKKKK